MIFSRETMAEIVEKHVKENYDQTVKVDAFQQRKHHNVIMFEAKLSTETNERNITDEA